MKRLIKFQKKNKIPQPNSSSEDEVGLDETKLCDDSSDELSDDESHVQTSLSLDNIEADDRILVEFEKIRWKSFGSHRKGDKIYIHVEKILW